MAWKLVNPNITNDPSYLEPRISNDETNISNNTTQLAQIAKQAPAPNGVDDTSAIQSVIDSVSSLGGGRVIIPNGNYWIKANVPTTTTTNFLRDEGGIALKDNIHLILSENTVLNALPTSQQQYQILRIYNRTNVTIEGGQILGERNQHTGTGGEWGYGISIQGGSYIKIKNTQCNNFWGDGINLQALDNGTLPQNIYIEKVKCTNNRRQGMSIEGGTNIFVEDSEFSYTNGTAPECGVDIEPYNTTNTVTNVRFTRCTFKNNNSNGVFINGATPVDTGVSMTNMLFDSCSFVYNIGAGFLAQGTGVTDVKVTNSYFTENQDSEAHFKTYSGAYNISALNNRFEKGVNGNLVGIRLSDGENLRAINNKFLDCIPYVRDYGNNLTKHILIKDNYVKNVSASLANVFNSVGNIQGLVIENNKFESLSTDAGTEYFTIVGTNVTVSNNKLIGVNNGFDIQSANAIVVDNEIHGSATKAGRILQPGVIFARNVISGAANTVSNGYGISVAANNITFIDNMFYQDSFVTVSGTYKAPNAIYVAGSYTGLFIKGNKTFPTTNGTFNIVSGTYASSSNFIQEGTTPKGTTAQRSINPYIGDYFYDTTLNKPIWCKTRAVYDGSGNITTQAVWVDATGATV